MSFSAEESLQRLRTGAFLVARHEVLKDPNFQGTVILLCAHEKDGDYGLVLNRISHMPLEEVFESLPPELRGRREVHLGGPVEQDKVEEDPLEETPGKRFHKAPSDSYRIFLGYSGWGQGQLESEIEVGAWQVFHADVVQTLALAPSEIPATEEEFSQWTDQHPSLS